MKRQFIFTSFMLAFFMAASFSLAQENWPHWRGAHHNGISDATSLPMKWSLTENIKWKIPLPSWSAATPIIWRDRIFIMSPSKKEQKSELQKMPEEKSQGRGRGRRARRDPGGPKLLLLCI